MALPEPPPNVPRIVDAIDPGDNHYIVMVRMPTDLAQKYPDKPWGTNIEDIGLAPKDYKRFPEYTLVDVQPVKGSADLYWIFQKLDGPVWTTRMKSRERLIPQKFRSFVTVMKTRQEVKPDTQPSDLTGDIVSSIVEQQENTGKAVKVDTTETINENASPLAGKRAYVEREIGNTSESLVPDGTAADSGLLVVDSQVTPLGDGKSVKETVTVPSWSELVESEWNEELQAQVTRTEQYVAPPDAGALALPNTSHKIVNKDRSLRITENAPTAALNAFLQSFPIRVNLQVPDELVGASVVWTQASDQGSFETNNVGEARGVNWSLGASEGGDAHSSATLIPELVLDIRQVWARNIPATAHFFYLPMAGLNTAAILARLNTILGGSVSAWPAFKPVGHTISLKGMKLGVTVRVSAAAQRRVENAQIVSDEVTTGKGASCDFQMVNNTVNIPPTVHDTIAFSETSKALAVTASASIGWSGRNFPTVEVSKPKTQTAQASVSPTVLPATSPTAVPKTGLYLIDSRVEPYKWGYAKVYAETIDASILA